MPLPQSTLVRTPLVGLEDLQRIGFYIFFEGINNAIDELAEYWLDRDQQFDAVTGRETAPTEIEHIPSSNFHEGHKPSLIRGNPDLYPNIAVFAVQANPNADDNALDHIDSWNDSLLVEVMVRGDDEETTNRRIQRTVEAAVLCLRRNDSFGGATFGILSSPIIIISDLFAVNSPSQSGAYAGQPNTTGNTPGARYLWQGAQIQFKITKDSIRPSSGASTFDGASQVDYSQGIDQG